MEFVNKHSTGISLNERFTNLQTVRRRQSVDTENRNLLEQLDRMRVAMRLKKKSSRTFKNVPLERRLNHQSKNRIVKRGINATTVMSFGPGGRLKRANSSRNIETMRADGIIAGVGGRAQLRRSNSALNLVRFSDRVHVGGAHSRQLIRDNNATQRSRSRSRSRQNLIRTNSQTNFRRTNSKESFNTLNGVFNSQVRGRSASRQRNAPRQRSVSRQLSAPPQRSGSRLQRSNSRQNLNNGNGLRSGNNTRVSANRQTINERLGANRFNQKASVNVQTGRITKRRNSNVNGNKGNAVGRNGAKQRTGRSRTRVAQTNPRNQSTSRGRNGRQQQPINRNNQQYQSRQNANGGGRGRSRSRSRGRSGRPNAANKQSAKSKQQLDTELDVYMVKTKNDIDDKW